MGHQTGEGQGNPRLLRLVRRASDRPSGGWTEARERAGGAPGGRDGSG